MKKILFGTILSSTLFLCACAQNSKLIKNASAFYTVSIPGKAMKDDNGNIVNPKPIINRMIYIESKEKPVLESVSYNGMIFISSVGSKDSLRVNIGVSMIGAPVILKPAKNNYIWKIDLVKKKEEDEVPETGKNIILKGKLGKATFVYTLKNEMQLNTPDMP